MADENFWLPLYYHKLLAATGTWKDEPFGAYLRLLIHQFDKGSIPSDLDELETISPSIKKHWRIISKKFKDDGSGGLRNKVMAEIRQDILNKKEINRQNGSKGGRSKANKNRISSDGIAIGSISPSDPVAIKTNNNQNIEEDNTHFSIEECLFIALKHDRWVRANATNQLELQEFNKILESRGEYKKSPKDYKSHFSNWKRTLKKDEQVLKISDEGLTLDQLKEQKARQSLGL